MGIVPGTWRLYPEIFEANKPMLSDRMKFTPVKSFAFQQLQLLNFLVLIKKAAELFSGLNSGQ